MKKYLLLLLLIPSLSFAYKLRDSCTTETIEGQCILLCGGYSVSAVILHKGKCDE